MTQFDGYTLNTIAIGDGIISANKLKGFYGDSAQIFLSAAPDHSFSGMEVNYGTIDGLTYYFGKNDAILSAYFRDSTVRNILLQQTNGGRISAVPLTGLSGDEVTLYNTPSSHYTFGGYEITGATLSGDKFVIGGTDITAKAIWVADPIRLLSLLQTSGGRISANKMSGYDGDSVILSNTPSSHFNFSGYGLTGATLDGNSFVFNGSNVSANARWQQDPIYTVLLTQTSGGTITAIPITGFNGDVITLSANPSAHYSLTGWGVTGATLTGNQLTIGSSSPSVVGKFKEDTKYNLTLQQSTGGSITANKLTGYSNDTITLSNTPSSNYNFNSYSLTGSTLTGSQFNFGTSNVTAKANFTIKPTRTVTVNTAAGGNVVANPTTGYDGTVVTLSQTANAGYTFNNYSITGATLTGNQFALTGSNVSVQPNYTHNVYNLTLQTDGHGKLAAGKTTGYYNDTTTLTATPSANYAFNSYSLTGGSITNNTYKWGTTNGTVKANFASTAPSATIRLKYRTTNAEKVESEVTKYPIYVAVYPEIIGITGNIPYNLSANGKVITYTWATFNGYYWSNSANEYVYSNSALNLTNLTSKITAVYMHGTNNIWAPAVYPRLRSSLSSSKTSKPVKFYYDEYIAKNGGTWTGYKLTTVNANGTDHSIDENWWWYNYMSDQYVYDYSGSPTGLQVGLDMDYYDGNQCTYPWYMQSNRTFDVDLYW